MPISVPCKDSKQSTSGEPSQRNSFDANEIYVTDRRQKRLIASQRNGPIPIEEDSGGTKTELLGKLSIANTHKEVRAGGLAGSLELLGYFQRLAQPENENEKIDIEYLKAILRSYADINFADRYGQTVLHAAARDWHPDVARILIDRGADVNKADTFGRTPLFIATSLEYPEMIEFLVSRGADVHAKTYGEKQSPIHYAAKMNAVSSLKILLKLGADVRSRDYKGRCPLYLAAEQGHKEAATYLLDLGCPAASFDHGGYSAMAIMVEKIPAVAHHALSQFMSVNTSAGTKSFYLAPLEWDPSKFTGEVRQKTVLQLIVKFEEMELLSHPVIQRLMQLKFKKYARFHVWNYFFLNAFYLALWTTTAILMSVYYDPYHMEKQNHWRLALFAAAVFMTIASVGQQVSLARSIQSSEHIWQQERIERLEKDLPYCHPQWPMEKHNIEAQIKSFSTMVGDYYKNAWTYLELLITLSVLVLVIIWILENTKLNNRYVHEIFRISMTVVIFLIWLRLLKACRSFQTAGQFITIMAQVIIALGQFAFLFLLLWIPFVVAFWIFFGGAENGDKYLKVLGRHGDTYRNLNDVMYTVWTLTVLVGFPMQPLRTVDKRIALAYISIYYLVMSIVCLNLFVALLSHVFSRVYKDATKYALLERAKAILNTDGFVGRKHKASVREYVQNKCNPLTEALEFRETMKEQESWEYHLDALKINTQAVTDQFHQNSALKGESKAITISKIGQNIQALERHLLSYDTSITKIQKFKVETKKIFKFLGIKSKK